MIRHGCVPVPVTPYKAFCGGNSITNCEPFVMVNPLAVVTVEPPMCTSPLSGSK